MFYFPQVKSGTIFDNVLITDDVEEAETHATEYWAKTAVSLSPACMDKFVEFGHLIHGKFCFWREIFPIMRGDLLFRFIFWSFSYIFDAIFDNIPGKFPILFSLRTLAVYSKPLMNFFKL